MSQREPNLYIEDILTAIKAISDYIQGISNWEEFRNNKMVFDAVVRNFEIIGEAVRHLINTMKINEEEIPWPQIISLRNRISHEYFNIDAGIIWKTIEDDLPILRQCVEGLNKELK